MDPREPHEAGQSMVELALAVPLLLLVVLGVADFGRAFYYTTAITNAAKAGAVYAAMNPSPAPGAVAAHVCNETGFVAYSPTATCPGLSVDPPLVSDQVVVTVHYNFYLISGYLVNRIVNVNPIPLRASATYPRLSQ